MVTKQRHATRLDGLLTSVDLKGMIVQRHLLRNDDVSKSIVKLAKNREIDRLDMSIVCRIEVAGFFIANTTEKVLREVNFSVPTVK